MAAKRRISAQTDPVAGFAPAPLAAPLEAAGAAHRGVDSPAVQLQARLTAALTTSPWAGHVVESPVDRWPGAVRMAILLGGAGASWALVWQGVQFFL